MKKRVKQAKPKKSATRSTKVTRIKTGIDHLDTLIGGGLIEKSITLVAGGAGSGKTIFAMQFLLEGLKLGESCIYLTFEEKKEKLYGDMAGFGWNFEKYENDKHFFYLEHSRTRKTFVFLRNGRSQNKDYIAAIFSSPPFPQSLL